MTIVFNEWKNTPALIQKLGHGKRHTKKKKQIIGLDCVPEYELIVAVKMAILGVIERSGFVSFANNRIAYCSVLPYVVSEENTKCNVVTGQQR